MVDGITDAEIELSAAKFSLFMAAGLTPTPFNLDISGLRARDTPSAFHQRWIDGDIFTSKDRTLMLAWIHIQLKDVPFWKVVPSQSMQRRHKLPYYITPRTIAHELLSTLFKEPTCPQ